MLFANFNEWLGQQIAVVAIFIWIAFFIVRKLLKSNPAVKDAAKKAATHQAIHLITRYLK